MHAHVHVHVHARAAAAVHLAAPGQPGQEGRGWYPQKQSEEALDPVARTVDQSFEVLHTVHFMGGEYIC